MQSLSRLLNALTIVRDAELRRIRNIIRATAQSTADNATGDAIYRDRLIRNPLALKLSFWENHFEWKALLTYPEIHGNILDFGCGTGHSDVLLARAGLQVHGIDLSPLGISIARNLRDQEPLAVQQLLSFAVSDVVSTAPPSKRYDAAWASHVFEHIADPAPILKSLCLWLKPGAHILISVPLGYAYDDPGHVHHFQNGNELAALLGSSIHILKINVDHQHSVIRALCKCSLREEKTSGETPGS